MKLTHAVLFAVLCISQAVAAATSPAQQQAVTLEKNKEIVRKVIEEVFGKGDIAAIDQLYSVDYVDHSMEHERLFGVGAHREGTKDLVRAVRAGLSNLKTGIDRIAAEGDLVACVMRASGTHTGTFMGVAATGKPVVVVDYHFFRIENGKIREHWHQYNTLELMQQLGMAQRNE